MQKRIIYNLIALLTILLLTTTADAGLWQKFKSTRLWPFHWPETLMVTGNYAHPRLLAEIAQGETNFPIILVSPEGDDERLYYLPPNDDAIALDKDKYLEFIDVMLDPKRVVFIGDEKYIPAQYIERVEEKYSTVTISGNNWLKNAEQLERIIKSSGLTKDYRKALQQLLTMERREGSSSSDDMSRYQLDADEGGEDIEADEEEFPFFDE
ncbi:MAG: hypothetical protein ACOCZS_02575 [Verrucomicrobiota bacterium]